MKYIFTLWAILFCQLVSAQGNELAIQAYKDAEEAFNNGKYETALSNLDIAETMLKTTNPKIQGLKLKSYKQLALADSTKNFSAYSAYVTELKTKKSDLANDAVFELSNFSKEKAVLLENRKNSLINSVENISIGQSFSSMQKELYGSINFEKPEEENQFLRYGRKRDVPVNQIGLYEIVVDKNSGRIVNVSTIIKSLTVEELGSFSMVNFLNEKFAKFDPKDISSESQIEKIGRKEFNVVATKAKIDEKTSYVLSLYAPIKLDHKELKDKKLYFFTEGYEQIY